MAVRQAIAAGATRRSEHWEDKDRFDGVNAKIVWPTDNVYGIPDLLPDRDIAVPRYLAPYRTRIRADEAPEDGASHFFLDDYRFEHLWRRPNATLSAAAKLGAVLTPDWSLYTNWPAAAHIFNTYRSRWMGRLWQEAGLRVIPSISWADASSYHFAFEGVPMGGLVAVSTTGITTPTAKRLFAEGYREMIQRLQPTRVLCYGPILPAVEGLCPVVEYPTRWKSIRAARKAARLGGVDAVPPRRLPEAVLREIKQEDAEAAMRGAALAGALAGVGRGEAARGEGEQLSLEEVWNQ